MTLLTGKNGRHRYYACSINTRQGKTGCMRRAMPMDKLDLVVVELVGFELGLRRKTTLLT